MKQLDDSIRRAHDFFPPMRFFLRDWNPRQALLRNGQILPAQIVVPKQVDKLSVCDTIYITT